ncbi:hypothetical protein CORC01_08421 [Colletotrichum orchidophilum]|uniref:Uncharacterized protein n=1 Tax=Colletotrichum orchidophilum TaxID=1209926 RepID=A0A1G4B4J5_9PEZI|nr:uncharacterized protein CORC01_08421 [Colletotrichum orchidophilum]OHE96349.1 hypothetical protein CORC01_08421 [Colletotrichum orchidophilum]
MPKYDRSRGYDAAAAKSGTGHDSKIWSRISAIGLDHCGSSVGYRSSIPFGGSPAIARCQRREQYAKKKKTGFIPCTSRRPVGT